VVANKFRIVILLNQKPAVQYLRMVKCVFGKKIRVAGVMIVMI